MSEAETAVELTAWTSVQHVRSTPELEKLVGAQNSFAEWPPTERDRVIASLNLGASLGHVVSEGTETDIVGVASRMHGYIELRATWTPPAR